MKIKITTSCSGLTFSFYEGQTVDVDAKTAITGVDAPVTTSLTTGGKVTITQKTDNKEIAYSFEGTWKGNGVQTYTINMVDLYN